MKRIHAIAGLPRAGSTLFCNLLNQNPEITATSTSALPSFVGAFSQAASNSIEVKNLLNLRKEETELRLAHVGQGICQNWHAHQPTEVVFDKSRGWNRNPALFRDCCPDGKIVVLVRDLRDIFASIERQNSKNGILVNSSHSIMERYAAHFSDEGVVGGPFKAVISLLDTQPANVFFVRYEDFIVDVQNCMAQLYKQIDMSTFPHDPHRVEDTAEDPDGFYLGKFPHKCPPKIELQPSRWQEIVPARIAEDIMTKAKVYNDFFAYK